LIQQLQDWSDQELEELTEMIQGLLESRQAESKEENQETREDGSPLGRHGGRGPDSSEFGACCLIRV